MNLIPSNEITFTSLEYEPAMEAMGADYYDVVSAAEFPQQTLRFRNDRLLPLLGLDPQQVSDAAFIQAFGKFEAIRPFLALKYHGYQFGEYNSRLGDGRGFLYGQVRAIDGELYDFGTKGSGTTPYSRGGDGKLTLKGGVREVLAAEALFKLGVKTSRCLSMIETGEYLWRGDEPSPTRSSVMIRFSRSHIRFGTFERLHYFKRPDLTEKLLDHVIHYYYRNLENQTDKYALFFAELVDRVAQLAAQWMQAGFCHGVLNTDNMSITGESFDYGPYAFIPTFDFNFTAAYFDHYKRYSYGNQPGICKLNLEMLSRVLEPVIDAQAMAESLQRFDEFYWHNYQELMLKKLGFTGMDTPESQELVLLTGQLLQDSQVGYHHFFYTLGQIFDRAWWESLDRFPSWQVFSDSPTPDIFSKWINLYHHILQSLSLDQVELISPLLKSVNPKVALLRPVIESIWQPITEEDNWQPFYDLLQQIWMEPS